MKHNEYGFSTPLALASIFSLCVLTLSLCILIAAREKYIHSYKNVIEERKETELILYRIEEKMQSLKESPCDADEHEIALLINDVCDYDCTICDVSTGINKNFTSKTMLESKPISKYIESNKDDAFTEYGWISPKFADSNILNTIANDFERSDVFPLINAIPQLNIHYMSEDFITAGFEFCNIKNAREKAELIKQKLHPEITIKELAHFLEVSENHLVFDLIGTKTIFWRIDFETATYRAHAVFAAVPNKSNQKNIEKYILVEKNSMHKGGSL